MTTPSTGWHAGPDDIALYASGRLDHARASSVEAHLVACAQCRRQLAANADSSRLDALWEDVVDAIDQPRQGVVERLLRAMGVAGHSARLLAATRSLQLSWLVAVSVALVFSVVAASQGGQRLALFLVVAPMLPLCGVAAAFGPALDPTYELTLTTPMIGFRLLLLRASAVFAATVLLVGCAALALPGLDWTAAAWLLPALGLTLASLALATAVPPQHAALAVAVVWVGAVTASAHATRDWLSAFGPTGQAVCAVVVVAATIVVALRHDTYDMGGHPS